MNNTFDKTTKRRLGREGEHPRGDLGQLIILAVFLTVWIADSFLFGITTQYFRFVLYEKGDFIFWKD